MLRDEWVDKVKEAQRRIDHGWFAALCAALFYAFLSGLLVTTGEPGFVSRVPYLLILVVLAIGVALRSRVAATLLVLQALWFQGSVVLAQRSAFAALLLLVFGYWYVSALVGTVRWHNLQEQRPRS